MRFNDLVETVLTSPAAGEGGAVTRWRQCIDMLAQFDRGEDGAARQTLDAAAADRVVETLRALMPRLSIARRLASVVELGPRIESPRLVALLADDHSAICSATMARARLDAADWERLVPVIGPLARSVLRRRRDLGAVVERMLASFGPIDMSLPSAPAGGAETAAETLAAEGPGQSDIARIVERIEAFTARRERPAASASPEPAPVTASAVSTPSETGAPAFFSFETDSLGVIQRVDGAPATSIVGLMIGAGAVDGRSGPDGQLIGAFRRRAAAKDARFLITNGTMAGDWRISCEPRFDAVNGRFQGYAGTGRRASAQEQGRAGIPAREREEGAITASSTRQLVHELRTPLNAIQGFAEIIEQQLMGPVPPAYRTMARQILVDATRLLGLFDDLDLASRIVRGDEQRMLGEIDLAAVVDEALARFEEVARTAGTTQPPRILLEMPADRPFACVDRTQAERMVAHLIRIVHASLGPAETVQARVSGQAGGICLAIDRPALLRHLDEQSLLDPSASIELDDVDGPPLGVAFGLRLVRSLAQHAGGGLSIQPGALVLRLPTTDILSGEGHRR